MARLGAFGGSVSSRLPRSEGRRGRPGEEGKRKAPPLSVVLRDALELVSARRGRLAVGLLLLIVNRVCGLVLPGTTKWLLDDVIGKGRRELLMPLLAAAGAATLIQAIIPQPTLARLRRCHAMLARNIYEPPRQRCYQTMKRAF